MQPWEEGPLYLINDEPIMLKPKAYCCVLDLNGISASGMLINITNKNNRFSATPVLLIEIIKEKQIPKMIRWF